MNKDINLTDGAVTEVLNNKVDIDFQNVPSNSVGFARCSTEVTNCITEIPQKIKYTLENGTLTILAGSVAIVPYGTEDLTSQYPVGSKFIYDDLEVVDTQFEDGKFFVWVKILANKVHSIAYGTAHRHICLVDNIEAGSENCMAGGWSTGLAFTQTTDPKEVNHAVYNPNTNRFYYTKDNVVVMRKLVSFPLMTGDYTQNYGYNNIDQVFNGMGYWGSTVWVDKGVKGLIPNGRNEDGTLKNIEIVTPKILMETNNYTFSQQLYKTYIHLSNGEYTLVTTSTKQYDGNINHIVNKNTGEVCTELEVIYNAFRGEQGKITQFSPKLPFRAIDYSDKSEVSGWAMPSNKIVNLTLGASGTSYIAPANGWFTVRGTATNNYCQLWINNIDSLNGLGTRIYISETGVYGQVSVPVAKGKNVTVNYVNFDCNMFRFIYAEGEQ